MPTIIALRDEATRSHPERFEALREATEGQDDGETLLDLWDPSGLPKAVALAKAAALGADIPELERAEETPAPRAPTPRPRPQPDEGQDEVKIYRVNSPVIQSEE